MLNEKRKEVYSRKLEDYLEAILAIINEKGYARTKDVSIALKVTPASVAEMFGKLHEEKLVVYRKYEGVTLTEKGREIASSVQNRHTILQKFLEIIEVPPDIANNDACIMEHHLHPITIEQLNKLIVFVESAPESPKWLEHYKIFCKTGKHDCKKHSKKD